MTGPEKQGRRMVDGAASYLSGSASVKDDLQAIYTLNKEIGAALWTVLTHLEALKSTLTGLIPEFHVDVNAKLEDISRSLDALKNEHVNLSKRLETLDALKTSLQSNSSMLEDQELLQSDRQVHFDKIVKILYTTNGYDENGVRIPEAIMRFDRWSKILHNAFWSFVVTAVLSGIFYSYAKGREQASEEKAKAIIDLIEKTKEVINNTKTNNDEQERRDKIVADHDDAMAAQVRRTKDTVEKHGKNIKRNETAIGELEKK